MASPKKEIPAAMLASPAAFARFCLTKAAAHRRSVS